MAAMNTPRSYAAQFVQPDYITPNPDARVDYQRDIYTSLRRPPFSVSAAEWENLARRKVPASNFGYVFGSAGQGWTHAANRAAFDRYRLKPNMLVNCTRRDMSVEILGRKYPTPLLVAPVGVQGIMHSDAEEATARACKNVGVPMVLSTAATRTIEQVAEANGDGVRWYQLYWPKPQYEDITVSLLRRAKAAGYTTLVVTLDTFYIGYRPTDLDESYLPFIYGQGCQIGFSDPVFNERYEAALQAENKTFWERSSTFWDLLIRPRSLTGALKVLWTSRDIKKSIMWLDVMNSGTYREWKHLEILKKVWDGPIVLKGVQKVEDARRAAEFGMSGIIVSNHGGRQLDGAMASLDALAEIAADEEVKRSGITILFDSGIRTGSDVLKAVALGAKAVLVARPYMYGLAIAGQNGVEHVLKCILADIDNSLGNVGKKSLQDLSREDLHIWDKAKL